MAIYFQPESIFSKATIILGKIPWWSLQASCCNQGNCNQIPSKCSVHKGAKCKAEASLEKPKISPPKKDILDNSICQFMGKVVTFPQTWSMLVGHTYTFCQGYELILNEFIHPSRFRKWPDHGNLYMSISAYLPVCLSIYYVSTYLTLYLSIYYVST